MPDIQLAHLGDGGHGTDIGVAQAMAHVAFEAKRGAKRRPLAQALELGLLRRTLQLAVAAGMQLDDRRAQHHRRLELARVGLDEQRDPDAGVAQPGHHRLQMIVLAGRIEATLGGPLLALLGHDAGGVWAVLERNGDHLGRRRHLEIERDFELAHQSLDVRIDDMAAILAQMRGDAVGAGLGGDRRGTQRIGQLAAARVTHRGDVIDVHSETEMRRNRHGRLYF